VRCAKFFRITHSGNMQCFFIAMSVIFVFTGGNKVSKAHFGSPAGTGTVSSSGATVTGTGT
jgi:hypothetical protein